MGLFYCFAILWNLIWNRCCPGSNCVGHRCDSKQHLRACRLNGLIDSFSFGSHGGCSARTMPKRGSIECRHCSMLPRRLGNLGTLLPLCVLIADAACAYFTSQVIMISTEINVCTVASGCPTSLCVQTCEEGILESSVAAYGSFAGEADFNSFISFYVFLLIGIYGDCSPYLYCADICNYLPSTTVPVPSPLPTSRPSADPSFFTVSFLFVQFGISVISVAIYSGANVRITCNGLSLCYIIVYCLACATIGISWSWQRFNRLYRFGGVGFVFYRRGLCSRIGFRGPFARWFGSGEHMPMTEWDHLSAV